MAKLQYKTRANTNFRGKPKVYFSCHPKDFSLCFPSVSADILRLSNCSVWYDEQSEDAYDEESFFSDLRQMQLFVMPVTRNLLYTKNRAIETELKFALENHIPVLPLMQEPSLLDMYKEKFGNLQYLDKTQSDKTALSFEEKLGKFLDSVLIKDELQQKIRDSFDAYVFLSYRKKDRRFAQELMKLIHENEFCRDIAIWYDEFLSPGEDFNEAIRDALQKSHLFALVVTPNLVNETNYVMTTEYPMAKTLGKKVLAAEMQETNKTALSENYENLPALTDPYDQSILSGTLLENLKNIAVRENDNDPTHLFFIGLAYLSGIDVEVNTKKAVELITLAAEKDLPQAIEKLIFMYSNGEGVEIDIEKALTLRRKLSEVYETLYNEHPFSDEYENWLTAWFSLASSLNDYGRYEEAVKECEAIIKHCQMDSLIIDMASDSVTDEEKKKDNKVVKLIADRTCELSHGIAGEACRAMGDLENSKKHLLDGLSITSRLCQEYDGTSLLRDLSTQLYTLGDLCHMENDKDTALECFLEALNIKEHLADNFGDIQYQIDLAVLCENISTVYKFKGDLENAYNYQNRALLILSALHKEMDEAPYTYSYLSAMLKLSDIHKMNSDIPTYISSLEETLKGIEEYEERYDYRADYLKCQCYLKLSQAFILTKDDRRKYYARKALETDQRRDLPPGFNPSLDLSISIFGLNAQVCMDEDNYEECLEFCKKAEKIIDVFLSSGIHLLFSDYIFIYNIAAQAYLQLNRISEAKTYLHKSEALILKFDLQPDTHLTIAPFLMLYANLGDLYYFEENEARAIEYYKKAIEIYEEKKHIWPAFFEATPMHQFYFNIAYFNEAINKQESLDYYYKTVEYISELPDESLSLNVLDILCASCYGIAHQSGILKRKVWKKRCEDTWALICNNFPDSLKDTISAEIFM